ncbi:mitochondrial-processing peptidase subunit beta [Ramicandelaber brevisporus]|nr:mitochondrial-processing peptidase subunit beta [Ramicandelaber brevisporus]
MATRALFSRLPTVAARSAFMPSRRMLASVSNLSPRTQTTTLKNGLTVATEHQPGASTATVGVWIDAGSRAESEANNGTAHFLEHMAFKGTKTRTQHDLEIQIEDMGAHLNAYTSREQTCYYAKSFTSDVPTTVGILSDILQNSTLENNAVERERDVILREEQEVNKVYEEVVFDHLHATAFQGHSLGRTILGSRDQIRTLKREDLANYIKTHYSANRVVLAGAGGIKHEELVALAEKHFSALPADGPNAASSSLLGVTTTAHGGRPSFVGSEVRIRNDDIPQAHIAIAVEGAGWNSPDYYTLLVMQALIGNWDRSLGTAPSNVSSRLAHVVGQNHLANSFMSFNTSYSDTGLWGIYLVSENTAQLDDLVHFTVKEWARLSVSVTEGEVVRARQQLKAAMLLSLDGTTAVAEDIGRQIVTTGKRVEPSEVAAMIDQVTAEKVRKAATEYLWDREMAIVALGSIEALPDFNAIRGALAWNRV